MILVKLVFLLIAIFIVVKAIQFGIKFMKKIDREYDANERMDDIKADKETADKVNTYKTKHAKDIKNQKENRETLQKFVSDEEND